MKTLSKITLLACLCFLISSCKKTDRSPAPIQVQVSGLTTKTSLSIKITDLTQGNTVVLNIVNQFGNKTYTGSNVNPGDQLSIYVTANVNDNLAGDGDGTLIYLFKGKNMGAHGGQINIAGFTETETVPEP